MAFGGAPKTDKRLWNRALSRVAARSMRLDTGACAPARHDHPINPWLGFPPICREVTAELKVSQLASTAIVVHVHVDSNPWLGWLVPFGSGVAAAAFGFALALWWDVRRDREMLRRLDASVVAMMEEEVATNLAVLELNERFLKVELLDVDSGVVLVDALSEIQLGAWESIRGDLTRWLPEQTDLFARFRSINISGVQMNQLVRNRELYKTHQGASQRFPTMMREYDEAILEKIARLRTGLSDVQIELRALERSIDPDGRRGR